MNTKNLKWLCRNGMTPKQVGCIDQIIKESEREQLEKAFILFMGFAINILSSEGYWPKDRNRLKRFIQDTFGLWHSVDVGAVDWNEVLNLVEEVADVKIILHYFEIQGKTGKDMLEYKKEPPKERKEKVKKISNNLTFAKDTNPISYVDALENLKKRVQSPDIARAVEALEKIIEMEKAADDGR